MDWLQFFASVVGSTAWPLAVVALAFLLRAPLGKLVPLIRTVRYKDLQIDVGHELEAAREKVEESGTPSIVPEEPTRLILQMAELDPRAAVISAWAPVELGLKDLGMRTGAYTDRSQLYILIRRLRDQGAIDQMTFDVLQRLIKIRNQAVHVGDISFNDAISMSEMCEWTVQVLKRAGAEIESDARAHPRD